MLKVKTFSRKKIVIFTVAIALFSFALSIRLAYIMIFQSEYYGKKADDLHERERYVKAARGEITDRNGVVIAANKTVCTVSVIHSQIKDADRVTEVLTKELDVPEEKVRKLVNKVSVREKIKSNVPKETGDIIRGYNLEGVKVDEDYKRYYPYNEMASKVLGFTGADNQGIVGLEVEYEKYLKGKDGLILAVTDARGIELENVAEKRVESVQGLTLKTGLDVNIQMYAQQAAMKVLEAKSANYVSIIVMNPQNGEIMAMANVPEYNLNTPFELEGVYSESENVENKQDLLNKMWRNQCINDTYEPGSTFKIVTATAGLETGAVSIDSNFSCPGFRIVEDRRIRCHKTTGHGAETFLDATKNSCNPVFIDVGLRVGVDDFYKYLGKLGILSKTGVDLPGEASTIIHKKENVGLVELATMSFGQSFQITPLQLLRAVSAVINGGTLITPHFGVEAVDKDGNTVKVFEYEKIDNAIENDTCEKMKYMLEQVVANGGGKNGIVEGYRVGGKTATSQKLPRNSGRYISSFIGFAPADNPQIIAICIIDEPEGVYYGGTIAAPVIRELYENVLPYLGIEKDNLNIEEDNTESD